MLRTRTNYSDTVHLPAVISEAFNVSRSEARRALNMGGVKIDGRKILDFDLPREWVEGKEIQLGRRVSRSMIDEAPSGTPDEKSEES